MKGNNEINKTTKTNKEDNVREEVKEEIYYYKILGKKKTNNGLKYHLGINVDSNPFNPKPVCEGGIFFSDKENICKFLEYGPYIAKIKVLEGQEIVKVGSCFNKKYKSHVINILETHKIGTKAGIKFMEKEGIDINWKNISSKQTLSGDFIRDFKDKVNWNWISRKQILSEDFIREFKNEVDWNDISIRQNLSEDFIREFKNKVNWRWISSEQTLSEDFIREFKDRVDWYYISHNQKLSEPFIREFKDKVDWHYILYIRMSNIIRNSIKRLCS